MGTERSELKAVDDRLAIIDVLLLALERRGELGDAIAAADDEEAAVSEVQQILGVAREAGDRGAEHVVATLDEQRAARASPAAG
jgi:hypothetical protein